MKFSPAGRMISSLCGVFLASAACLMATPSASAFDPDSMSDQERKALGQEIRRYLLDNPGVIAEAIEILQSRASVSGRAAISENAEALWNDGVSWVAGNPEGDVTIVEFVDYRCGYCRKAYPELFRLVRKDGNIRLIVKELPVLGPDSVLMSRFALAVLLSAGDEAYAKAHDALIKARRISKSSLEKLAERLGLDRREIFEKMESDSVTNILARNRSLAGRLGINGTPAFVWADHVQSGYAPFDSMVASVARIREWRSQ